MAEYDWNDPNSQTRATYDRLIALGLAPQAAVVALQGLQQPVSADPQTTGAITPGIVPLPPERPADTALYTPETSAPIEPQPLAPVSTPAPVQAQLQPQAPAQSGGFLGINNANDFGRRLQHAAAWIAPADNAKAALGYLQQEDAVKQAGIENARADQAFGLRKQEVDLRRRAQALALLQEKAPKTSISTSENGKFRVITKTNPLTGEVSFDRQAIPEDEQAAPKYPKAPANTDKMLNDDENATLKNVNLLKEGEELRDLFRASQIDVSLIGKAEAELKTLADSGDARAANAMRVRAYLQGAVNNTLRNEKGVQTDSDAKRVANEILSGNSNYNNKQFYEWLGRYMDGLNRDVQARTGRASNSIKRYGPDFDPDGYRARTFTTYGETGREYYERDGKKEKDKPYSGVSAPASAPRVTSPLLNGLRERFGTPGGQ